jgi:hypothetical protein
MTGRYLLFDNCNAADDDAAIHQESFASGN